MSTICAVSGTAVQACRCEQYVNALPRGLRALPAAIVDLLCALTTATAHRTEMPVLPYPQEQRQAINSVALLRPSRAHCEVVVGKRFAAGGRWWHCCKGPGPDTRLLYLDEPTVPASATLC